mgnify:CR=1 FL=1
MSRRALAIAAALSILLATTLVVAVPLSLLTPQIKRTMQRAEA